MPEWTRNKPNFLYILQQVLSTNFSFPKFHAQYKKHNRKVATWSTSYNKSYMFTWVSNFLRIKTLFSFIIVLLPDESKKYITDSEIFSGWRKRKGGILFVIIELDIILIILPSFVQWVFLACVKYRIFG